jgi:protocatechuate 3,4-dioxygenase alpha subunit
MAEADRHRPPADRPLTPSPTVGPFLHLALADPALRRPALADDAAALTIRGHVVDGDGAAVPDAVVETWQHGGPFSRCATDDDGSWEVRTARPVAVPTLDGTPQAPHLVVSVFARGLLDRVVTRLYLPDEPANGHDPALAAAGDRAAALVARADGPGAVRFDIHLQGPDESVFFAV